MFKIPHLRWWIVAMIFFASVLNYLDRQALSILAPTIMQELNLSNEDYASVLNGFLVAYMIAYLCSGRIVDKCGVRFSLALFVGWWSVANICTAFARSFASLGAARFLLGLGEAGNYTAAPKAVSEWFPARERGLAVGIYTLGATIGATIAPVLIVSLAAWHSWQAAFVVTGIAGLLWLIPWLWLYRRVEEHPRLTDKERMLITSDHASAEAASRGEDWGRWWQVFKHREVWLFMIARMVTDPVWYFFQFWFAKYLYDARGLDQMALSVTWVIFLAADLGSLGGGWLSGLLIKRKISAINSRLWIMFGCAVIVPLAALIPQIGALWLLLAVGMCAVLAHMAWLINLSTLVVDTVPKRSLAMIFGFVAAGSSLGGIVMNKAVGYIVTGHSYAPAFYLMAVVHPLALVLLWQLRRRPTAQPAPAPSVS
jgi:ACS family hexuronate transporter-like MFS transporter